MTRRPAALLLLGALALAGCGDDATDPVPHACLGSRESIERALTAAPGAVALADGTRLSDCVRKAESDADLQNVGVLVTQAADGLRLRAGRDPRAALQLGYLIGAVRRGASHTNGIALELDRRLARTATGMDSGPAAVRIALARGLRAGARSG